MNNQSETTGSGRTTDGNPLGSPGGTRGEANVNVGGARAEGTSTLENSSHGFNFNDTLTEEELMELDEQCQQQKEAQNIEDEWAKLPLEERIEKYEERLREFETEQYRLRTVLNIQALKLLKPVQEVSEAERTRAKVLKEELTMALGKVDVDVKRILRVRDRSIKEWDSLKAHNLKTNLNTDKVPRVHVKCLYDLQLAMGELRTFFQNYKIAPESLYIVARQFMSSNGMGNLNGSNKAEKKFEESLTTFEEINEYYIARYGGSEVNVYHTELLNLAIESAVPSGRKHHKRVLNKVETLWSHCQSFPDKHEISDGMFRTAFVNLCGDKDDLVKNWSRDKKTEMSYTMQELITLTKAQAEMADKVLDAEFQKRKRAENNGTPGAGGGHGRRQKRRHQQTDEVPAAEPASATEEATESDECTCRKRPFHKYHRLTCKVMETATEEEKAAVTAHFEKLEERKRTQ